MAVLLATVAPQDTLFLALPVESVCLIQSGAANHPSVSSVSNM